MYRMPGGEGILKGTEAELFRRVLAWVCEYTYGGLYLEDDPPYDVEVFNNLTQGQQVWTLLQLAECMLREDMPACELTAFTEGALGCMRLELYRLICYEIDEGNQVWGNGRRSFREILFELYPPEADPQLKFLPDVDADDKIESPECTNYDLWHDLVYDWFADILWDDDFEDAAYHTQGPPELNAMIMQQMDIPADYYSARPYDPTPEELPDLIKRLDAYAE